MPDFDPQKQAQELSKLLEDQALVKPPGARGAGGTPGGVGTFFGLWGWSRPAGFGLTMLPLLIGVGVLFFDGKSKLGWFLTAGGMLTILAAVLMSLSIRWEPTSLFNTLLMFGLLAAGVGLIARSLRPYPAG